MKTATAIKPLPEHVEQYIRKNTAFNMFGLLNLSTLKSTTGTNLSNTELKKRILHRFSHEMVNNRIEFNGCDKYEMREVKQRDYSYFEILDTDTGKAISDSFISKNIPKGYGKVRNHFIKSRNNLTHYEVVSSHKYGVSFTKHLNENHKNKK